MNETEKREQDSLVDDDFDSTVATDNVGDASVEINVEELVAEVRKEQDAADAENQAARQRLDEVLEQRRLATDTEDLDDFDC